MTTETDHTPAATEAEPGNGWSAYARPPQEEQTDQHAAAPEAESDAEVEAEAAAETEAETKAEVEAEEQSSPVDEESAEEGAQEIAAPVELHAGGDPLLSAEAESDLLNRWTRIQISFVEDPHGSVQDADTLIEEIGTSLLASFEERRSDLAAGWQSGQPDTEQLRLALRQYRSFIDVILPT